MKEIEPSDETAQTWLIDVALPVPLRQVFSYRTPQHLPPEKLQKGRRVLVPFGHRVMFGVTWSAPYLMTDGEAKRKYRALISYEAEPAILSLEIANLVKWMDSYYHAPIGELLKLALPPGVLTRKEPAFKLTKKGEALLADGPFPDELSFIREKPLVRAEWNRRAGTKIPASSLRKWEEEALIHPVFPGRIASVTPRVKVVELTDLGSEILPSALSRTPRQLEILKVLQEHGDKIPINRLKERFPTLTSHLKRMEEAGLCKVILEEAHFHEIQGEMKRGEAPLLKEQQEISLKCIVDAVKQDEYQSFVLFGVTGSGKTEVYLRAVEACLDQGKQALLLVPEIALTPLMKSRIIQRFGEHLAILHSAVPKAERAANWARVLAGKVDVVLGARSGIFAPLPRLGLLIVDEEHDLSYKQSEGLRYHARDLALVRAKMSGAVAVLGSATPSLESWRNALQGKSRLLEMKRRATNAELPLVEIVDMRDEFKAQRKRPIFSQVLLKKIGVAIEQREQVMLLLNRRGFFNFLLCRKCGETMECEHCEVTLTFHKTDQLLHCHYCDYRQPVPAVCPACHADSALMQFFGEGTQQIQDLLQGHFPDARIDRLDRDRISHKGSLEEILGAFRSGDTQILVGTQMIAKGHDFHNVTLVGIMNADQGLKVPDFRSAEQTFQLVTQVAGRSGRGDKPGTVVIQTYMPEHYSIQKAQQHDYEGFVDRELKFRHGLFYPPFSFLVNILMQHENEILVRDGAQWVMAFLKHVASSNGLTVLGPTRAPIGKIKRKFRYQIMVKSPSRSRLNLVAKTVVEKAIAEKVFYEGAIFLDVDPYHFS